MVPGPRPWPPELMAAIARERYAVIYLDDVRLVPFFVLAGGVTAVLIDVQGLEMLGVLVLRKCRELSPSTAIVAIDLEATAEAMKRALDTGATSFLRWPVAPDVIARALRGGAP